jgi:hypothetical protein
VKLYNTFLTVTFDAGCFYAGGDSLRTFDNSLEVVGNIHDNPELLRRREMTLKEAIDLSLEVWRYLAEHPEIDNKADLPEELYGKIGDMLFFCPLCEYYRRFSYNGCGIGCALLIGKGLECCDKGHPYKKWKLARSRKTRREAATAIVKLLEAALEKENQNEKSN